MPFHSIMCPECKSTEAAPPTWADDPDPRYPEQHKIYWTCLTCGHHYDGLTGFREFVREMARESLKHTAKENLENDRR